jgi:hypothetical protein
MKAPPYKYMILVPDVAICLATDVAICLATDVADLPHTVRVTTRTCRFVIILIIIKICSSFTYLQQMVPIILFYFLFEIKLKIVHLFSAIFGGRLYSTLLRS